MNYYVRVFQCGDEEERIYEENMGDGFDFNAFKAMLLTLPKKRIRRKKQKELPLFKKGE